jgi:hypothetical protein
MTLWTVVVVILILALLGALPRAGAYSAGWGYGPSGLLGLVVVVIVLLILLGRV